MLLFKRLRVLDVKSVLKILNRNILVGLSEGAVNDERSWFYHSSLTPDENHLIISTTDAGAAETRENFTTMIIAFFSFPPTTICEPADPSAPCGPNRCSRFLRELHVHRKMLLLTHVSRWFS